MQGVATLPPIFHENLIADQVKELFTSKFEAAPSKKEEGIIRKLSERFQCHGTTYNLKLVPEARSKDSVLPVQVHHLDFIAKQFTGQITTERIFKDGLGWARIPNARWQILALLMGFPIKVLFPKLIFTQHHVFRKVGPSVLSQPQSLSARTPQLLRI